MTEFVAIVWAHSYELKISTPRLIEFWGIRPQITYLNQIWSTLGKDFVANRPRTGAWEISNTHGTYFVSQHQRITFVRSSMQCVSHELAPPWIFACTDQGWWLPHCAPSVMRGKRYTFYRAAGSKFHRKEFSNKLSIISAHSLLKRQLFFFFIWGVYFGAQPHTWTLFCHHEIYSTN